MKTIFLFLVMFFFVPVPRANATLEKATVTVIVCGTSTGPVIARRDQRAQVFFQNKGGSTITICPALTCTATTGFDLAATVGVSDVRYRGPYSCISSAPLQNLFVMEVNND